MNVQVRNICKHFGKLQANHDISLEVKSGMIVGILGENGAGKSTLMKILSGFLRADSGSIYLDGRNVRIKSPSDAISKGIGMLHQDPLDFPPMKVIDNLMLKSTTRLFPSKRKALAELTDLQKKFNFNFSPDSYVETLTVGERQQLEILRLLWLGARVLILDEPTTGISDSQKEKLFTAVNELANEGKAILFVSHKLEEVEGLCHKVVVFRQGKNVGEVNPPYQTSHLVQMMFGKEVEKSQRLCEKQEQSLIDIQNLEIEDQNFKIRNINLEVKRGEVIGLAGMEGSGQRLILRALAGLVRPTGGKIMLSDGVSPDSNLAGKPYRHFKQHGISFLPAARLEEGLIPGLTLTEHFILSEKQDGFFVKWRNYSDLASRRIREFNIKGTPAHRIESLSGGNQQRALLALLRDKLNLLLLEHPTRGLDIESSVYIWSKLKKRCKDGTAIVFISSDLDEIIQYSDRIVVFFGGRLSRPIDAVGTTIEKIGQLIGGKGWSGQ